MSRLPKINCGSVEVMSALRQREGELMFFGSIKKKWYVWKRGGVTNITHNGEDYVARRFKGAICFFTAHKNVGPEGQEVCRRCGHTKEQEAPKEQAEVKADNGYDSNLGG